MVALLPCSAWSVTPFRRVIVSVSWSVPVRASSAASRSRSNSSNEAPSFLPVSATSVNFSCSRSTSSRAVFTTSTMATTTAADLIALKVLSICSATPVAFFAKSSSCLLELLHALAELGEVRHQLDQDVADHRHVSLRAN